MREEIKVFYELEIVGGMGEFTEEFTHTFDREIYIEDMEATDVMMVNFKMQELKEKYGEDIFLLEFSIGREGDLLS
jgi:hypothetical protein